MSNDSEHARRLQQKENVLDNVECTNPLLRPTKPLDVNGAAYSPIAGRSSYILQPAGALSRFCETTEGNAARSSFHSVWPSRDLTGQIKRRGKYPVAHGGFGDIWRCVWDADSRRIEVAVKAIRAPILSDEDKVKKARRLRRELEVWGRLSHVNVLPLYGMTAEFGPLMSMVCPWKDNGALGSYLERCHDRLKTPDRINLLGDVSAGLRYLHSCSVVHGDLSGSNILIDAKGNACLADFGLSTVIMEFQGTSYYTSSIKGAVRWAAPELFEVLDENEGGSPPSLPTTSSDIYSFGSVMLQVLTGTVPYAHIKKDAAVLVSIAKGITPKRPREPEICDRHWHLIQQCWAPQHRRPSIDDVVSTIKWEVIYAMYHEHSTFAPHPLFPSAPETAFLYDLPWSADTMFTPVLPSYLEPHVLTPVQSGSMGILQFGLPEY
ncbi:kinase-like protein [Leucogyrophana mollusca]|uniref:Kinase-like protein n=1 Tax=Leucogyrophana mollusca TaxID=85980 RepID=A0ACB8BH16_9AGAM|nr:kinase-like protein [Leucogyrophana mollusca]